MYILSLVSIAATIVALWKGQSIVLPVTILLASIVTYFTSGWVMSNRLGSMTTLSMFIKAVLSLVIAYALIGLLINAYLIIVWIL